MSNWNQMLTQIPEEEFEEKKKALALDVTKKVKTLGGMSQRYWSEIKRNRFEFNRAEALAESILTVKKEELIEFVNTYLQQNGQKSTRASFWQYGANSEIEPVSNEGTTWIEDFQSW